MRMNCRKKVGERKDTEKGQLCDSICFLSVRSRCWSWKWQECWDQGKQTTGQLTQCLHMPYLSHTAKFGLRFSNKNMTTDKFLSKGEWQPHGCFYWQISQYLILALCAQYNCSQWLVTKSPGLDNNKSHTYPPTADKLTRTTLVQEPNLFLEKEEKRSNSQ